MYCIETNAVNSTTNTVTDSLHCVQFLRNEGFFFSSKCKILIFRFRCLYWKTKQTYRERPWSLDVIAWGLLMVHDHFPDSHICRTRVNYLRSLFVHFWVWDEFNCHLDATVICLNYIPDDQVNQVCEMSFKWYFFYKRFRCFKSDSFSMSCMNACVMLWSHY